MRKGLLLLFVLTFCLATLHAQKVIMRQPTSNPPGDPNKAQFEFHPAPNQVGNETEWYDANGNLQLYVNSSGAITLALPPITNYAYVFNPFVYGTTPTAIASTITACASASCLIWVPATYPTTEAVPGSQPSWETGWNLNPGTTPGTVEIFDERAGDARTWVNPPGIYPSGNYHSPQQWIANYYTSTFGTATVSNNALILDAEERAFDGGVAIDADGYVNKTNFLNFDIRNSSWTPGQHIGQVLTVNNYSLGDALGLGIEVYCAGGFQALGDEGCEGIDSQVSQITTIPVGTIASGASTGATSLILSLGATNGLQGAGRFLLDKNPTGIINTGTVSAITTPGSATPATFTGNGTSWPVSTVQTTLGTAVTAPGSVTVTPAAMTGITTSTVLVVADQGTYEYVLPTAADATTFTATFKKPHLATAIVASGGLSGYGVELVADDYTSGSDTVRQVWPIIASTSSTAVLVWFDAYQSSGYASLYAGRWNTGTANTYNIYPMAEILSVEGGGTVSQTIALAPNSVAWVNTDSVEIPDYPRIHFTVGNWSILKAFVSPALAGSSGFSQVLNGIWTNRDHASNFTNGTTTSVYNGLGGQLTWPGGHFLKGVFGYGLSMEHAPDYLYGTGALTLGCPSTGCTAITDVIFNNNATGYDYFLYDGTNQNYKLSASNRTKSYTFGGTNFTAPGTITSTADVVVSTTISSYNGKATVGNGAPSFTGHANSAGFSTAIGSTHILADAITGTGRYRIGYYMFQSGSGAGGTCASDATATVTLAWTDPGSGAGQAQTKVETALQLTPTLAASAYQSDSFYIVTQSQQAINYSVAWTDGNCTTQPTASIYLYAETAD